MKPSALRARYWRIVGFFARVTAGFIFWEIVLPKFGLNGWTNRTRLERNRKVAVRFRALAIRMGGLMIKVGQFLSARLDVLPPEITDELADLQDEVPPVAFPAIRTLAEAELGSRLSDRFGSFDEVPLAAASLGQVHRARLCAADAEVVGFADVVVKVQRPFIEQVVEVDLAALRRVGGWLSRYKPVAKRANVPGLVEEFATTTRQEIDYLAEGSNAETFASHFTGAPHVHVPDVVWEFTTRRVLTLEDVTAIKLGDYDAITAAGIDRKEVAAVLVDTFMQQIFEDGFFHADPHPGNLFVTPVHAAGGDAGAADGASPVVDWQLTFVDFGMIGRVPENLAEGLREALIAVGTQDGKRLVAAFKTMDVLLPSADLKLIESASMQLFDRFGGMSMSDLREIDHSEYARFVLQFRDLMLDLPFQLPENLLLLGRAVAILSGMCSGLDPDFNIWDSLGPYAGKLVNAEGAGGGDWWETLISEGGKVLQTVVALPGRADRVLTQIERGDLNVQSPMLEIRVRKLERSVGRIASAVVFAGLLITGALLLPNEPTLAKVLMVVSAMPGLSALFGGRGGHPGPRG
ncbi:MAG TPA: AarF/UbiB family protein [Coriobacteriia bacterium]|nr:AarF/UbiB family protein [Coriobacteriia bacterium]